MISDFINFKLDFVFSEAEFTQELSVRILASRKLPVHNKHLIYKVFVLSLINQFNEALNKIPNRLLSIFSTTPPPGVFVKFVFP
jgi:uncharacterized protein VirK/YbjX